MSRLARYFIGAITRPGPTFASMAAERSVRPAILLACLPVLQVWGNILLHAAFGLDWLGTRPILTDPTYVGGFGHLKVGLAYWTPIFAALMPILTLMNITVIAGVAQLLSKLWRGQGTFEQTVNVLTFATVVPNLVIGAGSEWLFSVPGALLTGRPYWWVEAMRGGFGPLVSAIWNAYVIGVYSILQYVWIVVLGSVAVKRTQKVPGWAAAVVMLISFACSMVIWTTFTR